MLDKKIYSSWFYPIFLHIPSLYILALNTNNFIIHKTQQKQRSPPPPRQIGDFSDHLFPYLACKYFAFVFLFMYNV